MRLGGYWHGQNVRLAMLGAPETSPGTVLGFLGFLGLPDRPKFQKVFLEAVDKALDLLKSRAVLLKIGPQENEG